MATSISFVPLGAAVAPAISGTAWRDINADGLVDAGEGPLAGVTVQLRDMATNLIAAGPIVTAADGVYVFEGLPAGSYRVEATSPFNFLVSDPTAENDLTPIGGDEKSGTGSTIALGPTDDIVGVDLGIRPRPELGLGYFGPGIIDGGGDFDTTGTCASPTDPQGDGEDCGNANGVIRTQDTLSTVWSVTAQNYEPGAPDLANVIFEQTITPIGGAVVNFESIPVVCVAPPSGSGGTDPISSIDTDPVTGVVTLTCNLGSFPEGFQESFSTVIKPSGESINGSTFTVDQRVYSLDDAGEENAVPDDVPAEEPFEVSAAPAFDVAKWPFHNRDVVNRDVGFGLEPGYRTYFTFSIGSDRATGIEGLQQPFTLTDTIFAFGNDGVTPYPLEHYITECRPNPTGWGETVLGSETYSVGNRDERKVIDSGTCGYSRPTPGDLTSAYEFTLDGIDMSGSRYPTALWGGTDLSAGPFYVAWYRVRVWIPFRVIDAEDAVDGNGNGAIQLYNELSGFDPVGISDTSNFGDGVEPGYNGALMEDGSRSNNIIGPTTFELRSSGGFAKYLRNGTLNINGTSHGYVSGQTSSHSGDGEIEPTQYFQSLVHTSNNGTQSLTNMMQCDAFDNTVMSLTDRSNLGGGLSSGYAYVGTYRSNGAQNDASWPSNFVVEYAYVDFAGDDPLSGGTINPLTNRYDGTWTNQAAVRCDDPSITWTTDPTTVSNGLVTGVESVNVVRVRMADPANVALEPGEQSRFQIPFQARDTFFGGPHDGALIPTGTVLANFGNTRTDEWASGWITRNYTPSPESGNSDGDRLTMTRAQIRLQKHTLEPATDVGETGATLAGNRIVWELIPAVQSSITGAEATNVTIVDVLPPEATYNADCTLNYPGGTPAGSIEPNTALDGSAAPGYTRLTWFLGDLPANVVVPRLILCTDSDPLAENGTPVDNFAEMSADNVVTTLSQRSDSHTITLEQAGSIQLSKAVDITLDDQDDDQVYTLGFANFSGTFEISPPTLIDVFSYQSDGLGSLSERDPESDFSGTFELAGEPSVAWLDGSTPAAGPDLGLFEYSVNDPSTISYNPDENAIDGTTVWCTFDGVSAFAQSSGVAGTCPGSFADATAMKFTSNYSLAVDGNPEQGMEIDYTMEARGNEPGDRYTNRFGVDSTTLPADQFLRSNNVTVRIASFAIGDFVFADADGDGVYNAAIDIAVPDGVTVNLVRPDGTAVATTDTTALGNGRFLFSLLGSGDYRVEIPASEFQAGGTLENWIVTPINGDEIDDLNETGDQHGYTLGTVTADGVRTNTLTLSAIAPAPGQLPIGEEPVGENVAGISDATPDAFSNLTLDIGLVGPPSVDIQKEICTRADLSCDVDAAIGADGWADTTIVDYTETARWRVTVTNDGYQTLTNLAVTDPVTPGCARTGADIAGLDALVPNDSISWTCDSLNVVEGFVNTAAVAGDGVVFGTVADSDPAEVDVPPGSPDIAVVKSVNGDDANAAPGVYVPVGDVVTWTYTVTNPGIIPLADVTLIDDAATPADGADDWTLTIADLVSGDVDGDSLLDPSETWVFSTSGVAVAGLYSNFVAVTADPVGPNGEVSDADPANYTGSNDPAVSIVKTVNGQDANTSPGIFVPVGDPVTWVYTVDNDSNVPISSVSVGDDLQGAASYVSGDANGDSLLDPLETWTFELSGTAGAGQYTNVGTVSGIGPVVANADGSTTAGAALTDNDPANSFGTDPAIVLEKSTNGVDADSGTGPFIRPTNSVVWSYTVTNSGNVALGDVTVVDDAGTPLDAADDWTLTAADLVSGDANGDLLLDVDETWLFEAAGTAVAGQYRNDATVTGTAPTTTNADGSTTVGADVSDDDPSAYFGLTPGIAVEKSTNGFDADTGTGPYVAEAGAVEWTYTVTNTGNVALSGVAVVDDNGTPVDAADDFSATLVSGDANNDGLLDLDETWVFGASGVAIAGQYRNDAVATGTTPDRTNPDGSTAVGDEVTDNDPSAYFGHDPEIVVVKRVNFADANVAPGVFIAAGDAAVWTYTVNNAGNIALADVTLVDDAGTPLDAADDWTLTVADLVSGDTNNDGLLDLSETWTFVASGVAEPGEYVNAAVATGTSPETVNPDGSTTPGVAVVDDDPANLFGTDPAIAVEKSTNGVDADSGTGPFVPEGGAVVWSYSVTNPGNIALDDVTVVDDAGTPLDAADDWTLTVADLVSGDANNDGLLDVDETWVFEASGVAVDGQYRNSAEVTGTPPDTTGPGGTTAGGVEVSDDDPSAYFGLTPGIAVVKTVNAADANAAPGVYAPTGGALTWEYSVTNTGNVALDGVRVVDDAGTPANAADDWTLTVADLVFGDTDGDLLLDVDETWLFEATGTAIAGQYTNEAVVTGTTPETTNSDGSTTPGVEVSDDDPANVFGSSPEITIVKAVNTDDANDAPGVLIPTGDAAVWTYSVTNTGNVALTDVTVVDDAGTPAASADDWTLTVADLVSGDTNGDGVLDLTETWLFEAAGTATAGQYTNEAVASGTAPETTNPDGSTTPGVEVSDDDPANSYGTSPNLSLEKATNGVDADTGTGPYVPVGDPIVWTYTVRNTGNVALAAVTIGDDAGTAGDTADDFGASLVSGDANGDGLLDVTETWVFEAAGVATVGQYRNVGVVTGTAPETTNPDGSTTPGVEVSDDDPSAYFGSSPEIAVVKSVNIEDANAVPGVFVPESGDVVWTYAVSNPGNVALGDVTVVDDAGTPLDVADDWTLTVVDLVSGDTNGDLLLDVDETWLFEATGTAIAGQYTNEAVVAGTAPETTNPDGSTTPGVEVSDDDPANSFGLVPGIAVVKAVNTEDANAMPGVFVPAGGPVVWTYAVSNTGNIALADVTVVDDAGTPLDVADDWTLTVVDLVSGDTNDDLLLDVDETWLFEATGTAIAGQYTNDAVVTGTTPVTTNTDGSTTPGVEVSDDDPASYFGTDGGILLVKTVNGEDANVAPGPFVPAGDDLLWAYTVTNTSNTPLADVTIVDDAGTPLDAADDWTLAVADLVSGDVNDDGLLDLDEVWVFETPGTAVVGDYANVALVTGAAPDTVEVDGSVTPGTVYSDDDPAHHHGWDAAISLVKFVVDGDGVADDANDAPGPLLPNGSEVSWSYTATNTGPTWLIDVVVVDDQGVVVTCPTLTLAPAGDVAGRDEVTCTGAAQEVAAGPYVNVGLVSGAPAWPNSAEPLDANGLPALVAIADPATGERVAPLTAEDPANHFGSGPAIEVLKDVCILADSADCDVDVDGHWGEQAVVETGSAAVWRIIVTNIGNVLLTDVVVTDTIAPSCDQELDVLAPGESQRWSCAQRDLGVVDDVMVNVATATGTSPTGQTPTDEDEAEIVQPASYRVEKRAITTDVLVGDVVEFEVVVTNDGSRMLTDISVTDTPPSSAEVIEAPAGADVSDAGVMRWVIGELAPGESESFRYKLRVTEVGEFGNVVAIESDGLTNIPEIAQDDPDDNTSLVTLTADPLPPAPPLAFTGRTIQTTMWLAALLISLGFVFLIGRRRREATAAEV